ncbi:type I restriction enzyme HsdR N-terminal domain-containing protein [Desulfuribacillus alkaliarsenatis]|uniref:Type I restriction enzyme R protein N-terminal domain-containing protein n=1 Tax=Desulfuribacillus alkaliarsenatis TaxID=766136 RepID=A0A1E5G5F5_9FIRM|nr:type I restriction enzyme HsdR N-terminal domain-containing protein [Desulfuribacillus alkaliarsenatis]OEF98420.1 hypothetical protein BHF68_01725 [Desulfuribacillus alkaliarsenatis]
MHMVKEQDIKLVKDNFHNLLTHNEANISSQVVEKMLEILGYESRYFDRQHPTYHKTGYTDIAVKIDEDEYLYVEVKKDKTLSEADIEQIIRYLNQKGLSWGILTNGANWLLLNNDIKVQSALKLGVKTTVDDKVVFNINIFGDRHNTKFLPYFSKKSIFESEVTNYFKDIAQFRAYRFPKEPQNKSWQRYKSTLNNFFIYYSDIEKKYRSLSDIRDDEFKKYLLKSGNPAIDTHKNKWTHIRTMLKELKKNKHINHHNFETSRDVLMGSDESIVNDLKKEMFANEYLRIFYNTLDTTQEATRNKTLFLIIMWVGADISFFKNIEQEDFDYHNEVFKKNGKIIPLHRSIIKNIREVVKQNKRKKYKKKNLFIFTRNGVEYTLSEGNLSHIFKTVRTKNIEMPQFQHYKLTNIRKILAQEMFKNNYTIEEISYITSLSLSTLSECITLDDIKDKVDLTNKRNKLRKHPFQDFFDNID